MTAVFLLLSGLYAGLLISVGQLGSERLTNFYRFLPRPLVFSLALGVYCTAWTFFGAVGTAAREGYAFLPLFLGPVLPYTFGYPILMRVVRISQRFKVSSVAEFIALRFGKSELLAAIVALISMLASIPYFALQLKALTLILGIVASVSDKPTSQHLAMFDPVQFTLTEPWILAFVTLTLALSAIAIGARAIKAQAEREGLICVLALEASFKLLVFLALGFYVVFGLYRDPGILLAIAHSAAPTNALLSRPLAIADFWATTMVVALAAPLLPRLFHVAVVDNAEARDFQISALAFPLYLFAIAAFVMPIALAGQLLLPKPLLQHDIITLALPLYAHAPLLALLVALAGISAGAAMVIMAAIALSTSLSNDFLMPLILRSPLINAPELMLDGSAMVLSMRRISIVVMFLLSCLFLNAAPTLTFTQMGLLSMLGIAQIAPALGLGLMFSRITRLGALSGICTGTFVFVISAVLPLFSLDTGLEAYLLAAPAPAHSAAPFASISFDNINFTMCAFLSLGLNGAAIVLVSALTRQNANEREMAAMFIDGGAQRGAASIPADHAFDNTQAAQNSHAETKKLAFAPQNALMSRLIFHDSSKHESIKSDGTKGAQALMRPASSLLSQNWRSGATVVELETAVARYLGEARTREAFANFLLERGLSANPQLEADVHLIRFADQLLASVVGAASARLILSLLLGRRAMSRENALRLLDEASAAIQYNRDLLQHALDHARQGVTVFDRNLRLLCWNREFCNLFDLPGERMRIGTKLEEILRYNADRGIYGPGLSQSLVAARMESLQNDLEPFRLRLHPSGIVIEIRSAHLPDGGLVTTYTDVTEAVEAEEALAATNELLEQRVRERTEQLVRLNAEIGLAKQKADEANLSKTRFLAAASHDILQPLHAARLYASSLVEKLAQVQGIETRADEVRLSRNIDASLEAVEEILTALLDISRLDAGAMKPELSGFGLKELLAQLTLEFLPLAYEKGLRLTCVETSVSVRSDRRLLRRLLQNFISNAIKYTPKGRVLVGVRHCGAKVRVEVWDTGIGISPADQKRIFEEFHRLDKAARTARGLGLGLSIVERLSRVLGHDIEVRSIPSKGSMFAVTLPKLPHGMRQEPVRESAGTPLLEEPLRGLVVIIIDNEEKIREGMRDLLSLWGCTVVCASHAGQVIDGARQPALDPDVVLADYHLDEGDGIGAILALREHFGEGVMAALITADRSPEVRAKADQHAVLVLHKPLRPGALRAALTQLRTRRTALLRVAG